LEVLNATQAAFGYLPEDVLRHIARRLSLPLSRVYGVATFYHLYTLEPVGERHCLVCTDLACTVAGADQVLTGARQHAATLPGKSTVEPTSCLGLCDQAPSALLNGRAYVHLTPQEAPALLIGEAQRPHLQVSGEPRVLTRLIGVLEPTDLPAHREQGAFSALEKVLAEMSPEAVIAEVKASGLTGRGGAGFPTGLKWEFTRQAEGAPKYVVCNFDESEPGTFKDRALMMGDPFRVIEGLLINGYAVGARQGYIFVRGEYTEPVTIVQEAIDRLYAASLLGQHILGSDFSFDLEIRRGAGAYICGEETALFEAIEGHRGYPRRKPPFPTTHGLFGKPTSINNVETLAVVPDLMLHGGTWWRGWGTEKSVGLRLFCLSGHVGQPGVVEAPLGITVRELIEKHGGGFVSEPQAILMGGAAGGFLHPDHLDTPLTHEALKPLGVPIGSGVIMVFNRETNLLNVLAALARFFVHESCGQCAPCRLGTRQMYRLLDRLAHGQGALADLQQLEHLGRSMKAISLCGLGQTAPNALLTSLDRFRATYEAALAREA
jgi:NADH-quinone oxidoreductase subunit F